MTIITPVGLTLGSLVVGCAGLISGTNTSLNQFGDRDSSLLDIVIPPNKSLSNSYFGMTIHHLVANPAQSSTATSFPPFSIHTLRLWDVVNWSTLEPANGQYDWTTMDGTIAIARQNGVSDFIFTLGYVPTWASQNPSDPCGSIGEPGSCDAPDMTALAEFLVHLTQRYCGVVQYFETWNEPNLNYFWNGTDAQLLAIASSLHQIAKDPGNCGCTGGVCVPGGGVNPNQVLLPSINSISGPNLSWLDAYLAAAGPGYPYADVASFHGYGYAEPEDIIEGVAQLKQTLARHGLSSLQLWDTEASWGTSSTDDQQQQASWLMRFQVAQAASGVARFVWYAYDNCAWGTLWGPACQNSSDSWKGLRLPGQAYESVEGWLAGASLDHCEHYQDGFWACELQRSGGYEGWMLWESTGTDRSITIRSQLGLTQYRDWQNNVRVLPAAITVDQMPVLVEN